MSSRTPGPLGMNDAADTPGPLGVNDHAAQFMFGDTEIKLGNVGITSDERQQEGFLRL